MTNKNNEISDQNLDKMLADHFDNPSLYVEGDSFTPGTLKKIQRVNFLKSLVKTVFTGLGFVVLYLMVPWSAVGNNWGSFAETPITTNMVLIGAVVSVFIQGIALSKIKI